MTSPVCTRLDARKRDGSRIQRQAKLFDAHGDDDDDEDHCSGT